LAKALDSAAASTLPEGDEWEVVVVDNNSTDQTRQVVEEVQRRHSGRFRYVFESKQGLSHARNAGIREARGDILAFMDDDVTVEATWLQSLTGSLYEGTWAGAGGRIFSEPNFSPPSWLGMERKYNMGGPLFAQFDWGGKPQELFYAPHGTNMAYRKEMFEKYGGFRTDLGRCGSNTMSNADTEFGRRLLAAGERLWYEPAAVVHHPVPEYRLRKEYFLKWWFDFGRSTVREGGIWWLDYGPIPEREGGIRHESKGHHLSILKYGTVVFSIRVVRWALAFNSKHRFYRKCRLWMTVGKITEFCLLALAPAPRVTGESTNQPPAG